jgi:hypothetical protein
MGGGGGVGGKATLPSSKAERMCCRMSEFRYRKILGRFYETVSAEIYG